MFTWPFGKSNLCAFCYLYDKVFFFDSNRIPEAALMARSYLPSKVSEIVALWREDLSKVNFSSILFTVSMRKMYYVAYKIAFDLSSG